MDAIRTQAENAGQPDAGRQEALPAEAPVVCGVRPRGVIWFIRHGETDWNAAGRLQGRRDTQLNRTGKRQAAVAGRLLGGLLPDPARPLWLASPLARAARTMEILRQTMGLEPAGYQADERLAEISFGRWEGHPWKDIKARHPAAHAARKASPWTYTPPDGESYADVAARLAPAIAALDGDAVIVSHGGVARALLALTCAIDPLEAVHFPVWQGRVLRIDAHGWRWLPEDAPPGHG
ncbi:histidine phosphatase family protein [Camelimonas lactis]|uniref:Putative phosphoglycerate mutase n=1 Tax=Camelimonas lactis TaxID=659006 RepID=A0A4R2GYN6_9HYPH|nr:histidine phosphatase family protein [Camelimonas lactis]TCO16217.1 putative phosphoglycerate mutase [Camelimonas lactis]